MRKSPLECSLLKQAYGRFLLTTCSESPVSHVFPGQPTTSAWRSLMMKICLKSQTTVGLDSTTTLIHMRRWVPPLILCCFFVEIGPCIFCVPICENANLQCESQHVCMHIKQLYMCLLTLRVVIFEMN